VRGGGEIHVTDLVMIALTIASFVAIGLFVVAMDRV
jgi:hypothetical protein